MIRTRLVLALLLYLALAGQVYPASDFDGTNSQIATTATTALDLSSFSVGCWARKEGSGQSGVGAIISRTSSGMTSGWWINNIGTSATQFAAAWSGGEADWQIPVLTPNTWSHVLWSYNTGVTTAPVGYLDGVSQTVTTVNAPSGSYNSGTDALSIGDMVPVSAAFSWDGQLAECAIWNRILAANEVKAVACRGSRCGVRAVPRGLIGYWPLGVFGGNNYTSTTGLTGTLSSVSVLNNGPPVSYASQGDRP